MASTEILRITNLDIDNPDDDGIDIRDSLGTMNFDFSGAMDSGEIDGAGSDGIEILNDGSNSFGASNLIINVDGIEIGTNNAPGNRGIVTRNATFSLNNSTVDTLSGATNYTVDAIGNFLSGDNNTAINLNCNGNGMNNGTTIMINATPCPTP